MYKNRDKVAVFIGLLSWLGNVSAMNRDVALNHLLCKEIISILAINNYVMSVSTAYEALCKEAHLSDGFLHKIKGNVYRKLQQVNRDSRLCLKKQGCLVYTVDVSEVRDRIARDCRFKRIDIVYQSESTKQGNGVSARMAIASSDYYSAQSRLRYKKISTIERCIRKISPLLHRTLSSLLETEQCICIELFSPHHLSDWIKIINLSEPAEYAASSPLHLIPLERNSLVLPCDDCKLCHERDSGYNPIDLAGMRFGFYSAMFGVMVMTISFLGASL